MLQFLSGDPDFPRLPIPQADVESGGRFTAHGCLDWSIPDTRATVRPAPSQNVD